MQDFDDLYTAHVVSLTTQLFDRATAIAYQVRAI
jgi:hypothetical protein